MSRPIIEYIFKTNKQTNNYLFSILCGIYYNQAGTNVRSNWYQDTFLCLDARNIFPLKKDLLGRGLQNQLWILIPNMQYLNHRFWIGFQIASSPSLMENFPALPSLAQENRSIYIHTDVKSDQARFCALCLFNFELSSPLRYSGMISKVRKIELGGYSGTHLFSPSA